MRSARRQQHTVRGMLCVQGRSSKEHVTIRDVHHPQLVTRNRIVQLWLILIICVCARVQLTMCCALGGYRHVCVRMRHQEDAGP